VRPARDEDIESRLRKAGREFIESHREAEAAIREASDSGMARSEIVSLSGLSPETVRLFLR
jgi:hypothetical protein